jgi:hypothetical protein
MTFASVSRSALSLVCAAIVGCAIDHREQNEAGASDDPIDPVETQIEILEGATWPEGLWTGDTQFAIPCGTQSSRASIRFNPASGRVPPSASAVFGEQEKIPAVDPEQGYPEKHVRQSDRRCERDELYDGYPYRVRAATVWPTGRMTLWISADELYDEWCALQTSYPGVPTSTAASLPEREQWDHTCIDLPADEYRKCGGDPDYCPVNYDKFKMCDGGYCRCTEAGCRAPQFKTVRLDVLVADESMEGLIDSGRTWPPYGLKLRRVE